MEKICILFKINLLLLKRFAMEIHTALYKNLVGLSSLISPVVKLIYNSLRKHKRDHEREA